MICWVKECNRNKHAFGVCKRHYDLHRRLIKNSRNDYLKTLSADELLAEVNGYS